MGITFQNYERVKFKSNMKVYKSKIGTGIVIFIVIVLGLSIYPMIQEGIWEGLLTIVLTAAFIAYVFLQTFYIIDGDILRVKCGFLMNRSYEISRIIKITETNNPISAPAASLDRLEISLDNGKSVIVSPKQKSGFIEELQRRNPKITVYLKPKNNSQLRGNDKKS